MGGRPFENEINLAKQISAKAEEALRDIDRAMTLMDWPPEYRSIMWAAVADLAAIRSRETSRAQPHAWNENLQGEDPGEC